MLISVAGTWQTCAASAVSASKASSGPDPMTSYSRNAARRIASLSGIAVGLLALAGACGWGGDADVAAWVDIALPLLAQGRGTSAGIGQRYQNRAHQPTAGCHLALAARVLELRPDVQFVTFNRSEYRRWLGSREDQPGTAEA